ncbi:uncharacterized protein MEPE_04505 [Melanopsichium pennsylvanicum]|uniref:Uncharacterized protein n=2 Tax=Melanopsichium pennsylvanicum TaxID=63383 RepID=A0AAJ4XQ01_9BASI|nr:putative protein [Melanopsichium pennsylvanicum 4]SNX85796.1 uncharacterized protein MEPE_04505 [Melanopsichium pennsylvanicum]
MDAWSSPWTDDDARQTPATSKHAEQDQNADTLEKSASVPSAQLNSFEASDPWSSDAPAAQEVFGSFPEDYAAPAALSVEAGEGGKRADSFVSHSPPSAAWGDFSKSENDEAHQGSPMSPEVSNNISNSNIDLRATPTRQQSLSSYDPWTADSSSTWGAELHSSASVLPASNLEPNSFGWGSIDTLHTSTHELDQHFSSTTPGSPSLHTEPYAKNSAEATEVTRDDRASDEGGISDAWAAEASFREKKARPLDREEIDKLKIDARRLISSINTEERTQASFADPSIGGSGWTDLFGSQGTHRDKLHHLQTPPSAIMSPNGVLRSDVIQTSPATFNQVRSSIVKTENRGVRLTSSENNANWQRSSRPTTKADWLPDVLAGDIDSVSKRRAGSGASMLDTTSGPGWVQTSSNETRSTSGPSFLASFFKSRLASAASAPSLSDGVPSPTIPQGSEGSKSSSSAERSPAMSTNAQFEPYQDTASSRYTDDATGPDLMSLDTADAPAANSSSKASVPAASAQGLGLLSMWRNSGIFKSSTKKQRSGWATNSLRNDMDWLDGHESTESKTNSYRYDDDEDESFASFQNTAADLPRPPPWTETSVTGTPAFDAFDSIFSPAIQTSLNSGVSPTATSSARSSLSASRMSGDGGMMTISTTLGRANSIARKSAASPLQPPPQVQNKRTSIAPPPRATAASPRKAGPAPGQHAASEPFTVFLNDSPSQSGFRDNASQVGPTAPASKVSAKDSGGGLTADDLLFFDNL